MKYMKYLTVLLTAAILLLSGCRTVPDASGHTEPGSTSTQDNAALEEHTTAPVDPTQDSINTENPAEPESEPAQPVQSEPEEGEMTYRKFHDMTPSQQQAYVESFESLDAFFLWYAEAQEQYEKENPPIIIDGNGEIDLGEIAGNGD
ncbi:MAG: hypothetical protein IJY91_06100 [Oscillospiraceae bacterium]|nr:hypothetical protein [Oscillospiraceae bacterium]